MADVKISQLTALASASADVAGDVLAIVDTSVPQTKKITIENLIAPITLDKSNARIGIGQPSPATTLDVNGAVNMASTLAVGDAVTFSKSTNGDYNTKIYNANAGSSTEANIYITNSSSAADGFFAGVGGTGFTTASGFVQDSAWIGSGSGASGGLSIMTRANADMRFYTNGHTNLALTIDSSQNATFAGTATFNQTAYVSAANTSTSATFGLGITNSSSTSDTIAGIIFKNYDSNAAWIRSIRTGSAEGVLLFGTNSGGGIAESNITEKMRIKADGVVQFRDGIKFLASSGNAPTGTDHNDVPIKFASYTEAVDSTDVSNGSVDLDLDIYRDNYLSLNALLFDSNTNVVHAGLPADESWLKEITVYANGGVRIHFGSSVASGDTVKLLVAYTGNTG